MEIVIEPGLPTLQIDGKLSELALRQIVDNALKYSPPSSPIQIMAGRHEGAILVRVSNAGFAIPKPEQDLIFEKFYRGRDAKERVPGTGMGLAIAREIVEAHRGRIWLSSEPGKQIQFSLSFPVTSSEQSVYERPAQTVA